MERRPQLALSAGSVAAQELCQHNHHAQASCHPGKLGKGVSWRQAVLQLRNQIRHRNVDEAAGCDYKQVRKQLLPGSDHEIPHQAA